MVKKPDLSHASTRTLRVKISKRKYDVYLLVTAGLMCQRQVADKLNIRKQTVNEHIRDLVLLGLINPIDPNGKPKFYESTSVIPIESTKSGKSATPIISGKVRDAQRTLRKNPCMVRDKSNGQIKHWRKRKVTLQNRDYNTLVSVAGKRVRLCRVHGIGYTCTILRQPMKEVPWKPVKKGMRGMEQYDLKQKIPGIGNVTFRRQVTKKNDTDELIIWLPEKYFFEWELEEGEKLLQEAVWRARKWFQNKYKAYLGLAIQYRRPEHAFEIFEPGMRRFVQKKGTLKVETKDGMAMADESKKGYPEVEFPTTNQARAFVQSADRILSLEQQMELIMNSQQTMTENMNKLIETQEQFTKDMGEFMGFRRKMEKRQEDENKGMFS